MKTNAQVALEAAMTFSAPRFLAGFDEALQLADTFYAWLEAKDAVSE